MLSITGDMHFTRIIIIITLAAAAVLWGAGLSVSEETGECLPTQNDVEGPYYVPGAPFRTEVAGPEEKGERIIMKGAVFSTDCRTPVKDALIEVWQTDSGGEYHYRDEGYRLRGQMKTDGEGQFRFNSIKPGRYRIMLGFRPAHIHVKVSHPDYETLITQLYFKGDPYLWPHDACGRGCRSDDPRRIIALIKKGGVLEGTVEMILKPVKK